MRRLVKTKFNVDAAKAFVDTVRFDNSYYVFAAGPAPVRSVVSTPLDTGKEESDLYDSMLFGKRVKFDDIRLCTKRYNWVFGEIYAMYDDREDLSDQNFYVAVSAGVDLNVYKCLFNNDGGPSTVEPSGVSSEPFETMEDGYIWKYMYTISSLDVERFVNRTQLPVIEQANVIQSAVAGGIDVIKVESKGLLYNNYLVGNFEVADDIRVNGNPLQYALGGAASILNGFYKNCLIRINSNTVANGQFRLITDYVVVNGRKIITLDAPFDMPPAPADGYEIYPNVFIYDTSNTASETCVARAIVNPLQANSIGRIEILRSGRGYRTAEAKILPDPSVDVLPESEAVLRPILGPDGGHGSDPFNELDAYFVGISSIFVANATPIIANNVMQTVGIVKEPLFADCELTLDSTRIQGEFIPNERLFRFRPIQLEGTFNVTESGLVTTTDAEFTASLRENDKVLIVGGGNQMFADVTILDDQTLRLSRNPSFTAEGIELYYSPNEYFAEVVSFTSPSLKIKNVVPTGFSISQFIFGETSQAYAKTASVQSYLTIGSRDFEGFNAFNQITRLEGLKLSEEAFEQSEQIIQNVTGDPLTNPSAIVHSFQTGFDSQLDSLFVTNEMNSIQAPGVITTNRNDSFQIVFEISNKYNGELVKDSGKILYVENIDAITRNDDQTEIIKLYLEF